jgi:hypothetical protein
VWAAGPRSCSRKPARQRSESSTAAPSGKAGALTRARTHTHTPSVELIPLSHARVEGRSRRAT